MNNKNIFIILLMFMNLFSFTTYVSADSVNLSIKPNETILYQYDANGTLIKTIENTIEPNLPEVFTYLILIMGMVWLIYVINNKYSKTDFDKKRQSIIDSNKTYRQKLAGGLLQSVFKNVFMWNYFLGWLIILVVNNLLSRFAYNGIYEYFTIITSVYSLGLFLVVVHMIGFAIDYMKGIAEDISKNNWGLD